MILAGSASAALTFDPVPPQAAPATLTATCSSGASYATYIDGNLDNANNCGAAIAGLMSTAVVVEWAQVNGWPATLTDARLSGDYVSESTYTISGGEEEATTTAFVVDGAVFGAAVGAAMQMLTDNIDLMFYVFGIPLFLIVVAIILDWIKKTKMQNSKNSVDYIRDEKGRIIGGRNEKKIANDKRYQDTIYWASGGKEGKKM
jgi:hypothetical protein